ncbi:MAG TPA: efflux RND transporter periplasmic adaptor subunit, partial [Rhizomicrobium sp.]|nr:efflux RND transporter periplasmic adaptor subunit [Rhizomicrobium sp.]
MTNNAPSGTPRAFTILLVAATMTFAGCSPKKDNSQADVAQNVTLTDAQRQHIRLYTVRPSQFHKTIETSGAVDFDNDQATSVITPISGPVTRLLVSPGDKVKKGAPLATVDSSDFAAATSAYSKAM